MLADRDPIQNFYFIVMFGDGKLKFFLEINASRYTSLFPGDAIWVFDLVLHNRFIIL